MIHSAIATLLHHTIGMDVASIGQEAIAHAVRQRIEACGLLNEADYWWHLQESATELTALIETVVVPETWFFRDRPVFQYLGQQVRSQWISKQSDHPLRVLSVPCSTGEEPYSIVITLLEAGLSPQQFQIDAVDISQRSLQVARTGIYSAYSFRGCDRTFQTQYFEQIGTEYHLQSSIKRCVRFLQGNLVEPSFLLDRAAYDVIFCRNLFIYFDPATKRRCLSVLDRLLTEDGVLFAGHAETGLLLQPWFVAVRDPLVFAYRKASPVVSPLASAAPSTVSVDSLNSRSSPVLPAVPTVPSSPEAPISLEKLQALANQGKLTEAAEQCQNYLAQHPLSPEGYVLLGQVQQAMGQTDEAERSFQQALYLHPQHEIALVHLALLQGQQGKTVEASLTWERLNRLKKS